MLPLAGRPIDGTEGHEVGYGNYGGRAWCCGRRDDRCDAVLADGDITSSPGIYPGFVLPEARRGRKFHVLLGEGEVMVGLYGQSSVTILHRGEEVPLLRCVKERIDGDCYGGDEDFDSDAWREAERLAEFEVAGCRIHVRWVREDNYVMYVRLEQADGEVWTGWSGFEIGAGFDDTAGARSDRHDQTMWRIFDEIWSETIPSP